MTSGSSPYIVGLGGTVRPGSSSERALIKALNAAEAAGARTELFGGAFLTGLPIYNPHLPACEGESARLLEAVRRADGVIVSSPGYHGSISGLVKNALDVLEDCGRTRGPICDGRAVGCIVAAERLPSLRLDPRGAALHRPRPARMAHPARRGAQRRLACSTTTASSTTPATPGRWRPSPSRSWSSPG